MFWNISQYSKENEFYDFALWNFDCKSCELVFEQDLFYQAKYYLEHEDERKQIALAGFERVKRDFTFRERLEKMYPKN